MPYHETSILIVDDDIDFLGNMSDIFGDLGYRVETASGGRNALEKVKETFFDLALIDLRMPGMDGLALYREIKKIQAGTAAILVTAHATQGNAEEALGLGILQVMLKPIDFPRLMKQVQSAVDRPLLLVVDDDRDLCDNLWELLNDQGYRVSLAHGQAEATGRIQDRGSSYRVVLIDVKLPDGDGGEVLRQVREANPQAHALLITGCRREMAPEVEQWLANGAEAVFDKPFDVPELLSAVKRLA